MPAKSAATVACKVAVSPKFAGLLVMENEVFVAVFVSTFTARLPTL